MRDTKTSSGSDVVLGEDWVAPQGTVDSELRARREKRGVISINRSPLARKIIIFNLLGMAVMVLGVLYLNPFRDSLVFQRETGLVAEAELIADVFEATGALSATAEPAPAAGMSLDPATLLTNLDLSAGVEAFVFDADSQMVGTTVGQSRAAPAPVEGLELDGRSTIITDLLNSLWEGVSNMLTSGLPAPAELDAQAQVSALVPAALGGTTQVATGTDHEGGEVFAVATPILVDGGAMGVVALISASGELDALVRSEREQVFQMFVIAILVSIGLSLVLASRLPTRCPTWRRRPSLAGTRTPARSIRAVCAFPT